MWTKTFQTGTDTTSKGTHVLVIGGGASGVLMAAHLLRQSPASLHVTIIEGQHMLGCGVAYSTTDPDHLLNTRVENMSAYPSDPEHFLNWLERCRSTADSTSFVSRATYGAYMADLLSPWSQGSQAQKLTCIQQNCIGLDRQADGVVARLEDGRSLNAELAILATGHALPEPAPDDPLSPSWQQLHSAADHGRIVIIGSGLSMIDNAISLLRSGHKGEIVVVSRRTQLPRVHAAGRPLEIRLEDVPLGAPVSRLMQWLRIQARHAEAEGGTWRDAVDGLRPHLRAIWQALPLPERSRFLRHGASWWEVHRHRLPPESAKPIHAALDDGRIRLVRAAFVRAERDANAQLHAVIRPRGQHHEQQIPAARIIDCRGIRRDPEQHATPLVAGLLQSGLARIDALRLGLDVAPDCALLDRAGHPSTRIFAIGPVSRAAFWEVTAIPDIRDQTENLARQLVQAQIATSR